jgi:pSer/pThr/pTyr-binding forkhead associated (FHA) protein
MPRLDFYSNAKLLMKVRLRLADILIGRDAECDIQLPDIKVSRQHARIEERDGGHVIENLSPNGTRVNHAMVTAPQVLHPGDRIYIESSTVVYQPDDAASEELTRNPTVIVQPIPRPIG